MMPSLHFKYLAFLVFFSFTTIVNAQTPPIADFDVVGGDTSGCENLTVFFQCNIQTNNPIVQYDWDLGGQPGQDSCQTGRIFNQVGSYTITLIVTDNMGFKDTITKVNHILIHNDPVISFTASQVQGCGNLDAQLVNTSTVVGSSINSSLWVIGNNSYITPTANHSINTIGCQQLFLSTTTTEGCSADTTLQNYLCVVPNPNAGFTSAILSTCDTSTIISFTNTSTHNANTTYEWDFGDAAGTSTLQNPNYTYSAFGTFPVTLITTDPNTSCADTISQNVVINPDNVVDFTFSPSGACPGQTIQFTDQSIGNAISHTWAFGDGNTAFVQNPSHNYASPGCYTVTLTVNFGFGCAVTKTFDCITVSNPPIGSFTRIAGDKTSCTLPHSVTFDAVTSGAADFFWDFEGSLTAQNQTTPTHSFTNYGVYPISLVLISGQGCTTTVTMDTIEIQELVADFSTDTTQGCLPVAVNFTNQTTSTSPLTNTHWIYGDGSQFPVFSNNVSHGYAGTGEYDATLIVTNSFGCVDTITKTDYILVGTIPSLNFSANPDPSCVNTPITFTNASDTNATNFLWDFGDGTATSIDVNPIHAYQDTGTYTITMSAEYNGCPNTVVFTDTIQVLPPIADFTTDLTCDSLSTAQFINESAFATTYAWDFGDGNTDTTTNPRHTYAMLGLYTITLTATSSNGCTHTFTDDVNLVEPIAAFGDTASQACTPAPADLVTINNSVNAVSYSWSVTGGGTYVSGNDSAFAPVLGLDTAGLYDVTLIVTDDRGCMDTTTRTICVSDVFINDTEPDTSQLQMDGVTFFCGIDGYVDENGNQATDTLECYWTDCTPLTVSFVDSSYSYPDTVAVSRIWDFGNGDTSHAVNPTYTYTDPSNAGVYLVTLTISNIFGSSAVDTVAVIRPSQAVTAFDLADTIYCLGEDIGIDNNSTGLALAYEWNFGNGDTSTARVPAYAYDSIGIYTVSLTTTDMNGCDSTITRTITVETPIAGFEADTAYSDCAALTVVFADTSIAAVAWEWDFGTGNPADISNLQNPTFTFAVSDTYDIQLIITSLAGCKDTIVQSNLIVVDGPKAEYAIVVPGNGCIDHEVRLAASGINVAQYIWVTGSVDPITGVPDTITHVSSAATDTLTWTYTVDSIFNTELLVLDQFGCPRNYSLSTPIRTTDPQANFSIDTTNGCAPLTIQVSDSSNDAFQYSWRVPGANISNANTANPAITYPSAGIYDTIELVITGIYGCRDTMTMTNDVSVSDVFAGFSPDMTVGCAPLSVNFTDTSTTFLGNLIQWDWSLGDGTVFNDTTKNISHIYPTAPIGHGTHTAFLRATNDLGCTDLATIVIIPSKPIAYFEISDTFVCTGQNLNFNSSSTGRTVTHAWDFGDGNTSTAINPSHNYTTEDSFTICLTVTDENGCDSIFCRSIVVGNPLAQFAADVTYSACPPLIVNFSDSSTNAISWEWDLGNGSMPSFQNPITVYSAPDSFSVSLIVTSSSGCKDTLTKTDYIVIDGPLGTFNYSPLEGCQPFEVDFEVTAEFADIGSIDFGDGQVIPIPNINTFSVGDTFRYTKTYLLPGNYLPKLSLTDVDGCTRILTNNSDSVRITDPQARFTVNNSSDCYPFTVTTNSDSSTYVDSYQWFAPDAMPATSTAANPTFSYSFATTDTITLVITDIYGCTDTMRQEIISSDVTPAGNASLEAGCPPLAINFTNSSTTSHGTITDYLWNFGDGNTATIANSSNIYDSVGTFIVTLTTTNSVGCTTTEAIDTINIFPQPTPSFTVSDTFACTGQDVIFTNNSTGISTTYLWDFGDGNTSTAINPIHTYATEGTFLVTLNVFDTLSCGSTLTQNITVLDPVADFTANSVYEICPPATFTFNNNSINGVGYQWYVYNSDTIAVDSSTLFAPDFTLTVPDFYDVELIVTNASGCTDTMLRTDYLHLDGPIADYTITPIDGCEPLIINFTIETTSVDEFVIMYGDGDSTVHDIATAPNTETVMHTYSAGTFFPMLIIRDAAGCERILPMDSVVVTPFNVDFLASDTLVCENGTIQFTSQILTTLPVSSVLWRFEGADVLTSTDLNPSIPYSTLGDYDVTLIVGNGFCLDSITKPDFIKIAPSPVTAFTATPDSTCTPQTVTFADGSSIFSGTIDSLFWDFDHMSAGDTNTTTTTFLYDVADTFNISLTAVSNFGCPTTLTQPIIVYPLPVPNFTLSDTFACTGQMFSFTNLSTGSNVTYSWDFGDGNTDTTTNPTHVYTIEGTFNVCLTVFDEFGCQSVICNQIVIGNPVANFIAVSSYEACPPATFTFNNNSDNEISYQWYVYNSDSVAVDSSTLEIPSFTLTIPDLYDVELIVTSASGCMDTMLREDYLWLDGPIAEYAVSPVVGCNPLDISFTIETSSVTEFVIMYGDGDSTIHDITTLPNTAIVTHTYSEGTFFPMLILRDSAGCERILAMDTVTITPFNVDFLSSDTLLCDNGTIQFTSQILTTFPIDSVLWRFEGADILTSTDLNPSIPYSTVGDYDVTLIVGNGFCLDSITKTDFIKIAPNPVTAFVATPDSTCVPQTVTFTNGSSIFSGTIDSLFWNFDHMGATDTNNITTTFLYDVADTFNVSLTTVSDLGCTTTLTQSVVVYPLPIPDFTLSDTFVCTGQAVSFANLSTGSNITYSWNFGDGNTDTTANPMYAFATEDTFTVCLTVFDEFGCQDVICKQIVVANPLANFSADTTYGPCIVQDINFIDQSVNAVAWHWSFGDGDTSILQNPLHTYQTPGIYDVTLVVTSQSGCSDTLLMNDYITIDGPSGSFSYTPLTGCVPQDIDFTAIGDSITQYTWFFGNGDSLVNMNTTNTDMVTYNYQVGGVYYPTLRIEDSKGCFVMLNSPDSIRVDELAIDFTSDNQIICTQGFVNYTSILTSNQAIDSVTWILPGATNPQSTALNPANVFYNTLGIYDVTLIVHSGYCSDTIVKTDFIRVAPTPIANYTYQPTPICTDIPFNFTDSTSLLTGNIATWDWSDGLAYNDVNQMPASYIPTITGNINLTLTVTSDFGCVDDTTQIITVFQTPTADAGPDQHICINDVAYLNGSGGDLYQWTPSASLTCDTCPNPIANPLTPTTYQLLVTTTDGCTDTDLMTLDVGPFELPYIGLNNDTVTICQGETTQLFATGGVDITSYLWDSASVGLSCYTHCLNPFASPTATTTYHVQVTGIGGCVNYDSITVVVVTDNGMLAGADVTICEGDSYQLSTAFGDNPVWSPQAELSCTFCPNPIATPSETTTYMVTVSGANGCVITDTITVNIQDAGFASAGEDKIICSGDSAQIDAQGMGTISWTPSTDLDNPIIFNPISTPSNTTTYTATITNDLCTIVDSMIVFVETQASISGMDTTICFGDLADLEITGLAQEITWTPAESLSDNVGFTTIAFPTETTVYEVIGTLEGCLNDTTYVTVFVEQTPDIGLLPNMVVIPGQSVPLADGPENYTYQWSPNIGNISCLDCPRPFIQPDTNTAYTVVYQTELGCENTSTINVIVQNSCDENLIGLPQAFSPNGDGLNDIYYVRSTALELILNYRIYNQWGEEIFNAGNNFSPNDINTGWDGTYNGQPVNEGVYIYQVTASCPNGGNTILKKGNFMLIR
jgi:gliding motility-associated-like protein